MAAVVVLAAALAATPAVSSAARGQADPSRERERVRSERAAVAARVDALRATDAEVKAALADLESNVRGQQALLDEAQRQAAEARRAHEEALAALAAKAAEIEALRARVREFAVEAFIRPPAEDAMAALEADNPSEAAEKRVLLELRNEREADVLDQLSAAQEDLEVQRRTAEQADRAAQEKQAAVQARLDELRAARDQQAAFGLEVQDRLDRALAESAALAEIDARLSEQIRRQQAELAERARLALGDRARRGGGGGGTITPVGELATVSCPGGGSITVAASIADELAALLRHAASDGIVLCGGGYRSSERQAELRRINGCPDVHHSPASSCRVPTARPGSSMHERGLAVDFTCNGGGVIGSRSSPCFRWLNAHAASYGLYNLPSSPWHWSTNGN